MRPRHHVVAERDLLSARGLHLLAQVQPHGRRKGIEVQRAQLGQRGVEDLERGGHLRRDLESKACSNTMPELPAPASAKTAAVDKSPTVDKLRRGWPDTVAAVSDWNAKATQALHDTVARAQLTLEGLQLVGDDLLDAIAQGAPDTAELAPGCAAALRERDLAGDEELAAQLMAVVNQGPAPMLRPLAVDLDMLSNLLEGDPTYGGGRIDLETGDCLPEGSEYDAKDLDEDDDGDRWLYVWCEGSRRSYRDMELFIETLDDPDTVDRLEIAIRGKGAFRRFKDVLARWPEELQRYFLFSDDRKRGRARAWLAEEGYRPVRARRT